MDIDDYGTTPSEYMEIGAEEVKESIIEIIKTYMKKNDDVDNVQKTCEALIKIIKGEAED